jgi:hypothetical protein
MVRDGPEDARANAAFAVAAEGPGSPWRTLACEALALGHVMCGDVSTANRGEAVERSIEIGLLEPFPGLRLTGAAASDGTTDGRTSP